MLELLLLRLLILPPAARLATALHLELLTSPPAVLSLELFTLPPAAQLATALSLELFTLLPSCSVT